MFALQKGFCSFNFATRSGLGVNTSKIRIFMYKALRENDERFPILAISSQYLRLYQRGTFVVKIVYKGSGVETRCRAPPPPGIKLCRVPPSHTPPSHGPISSQIVTITKSFKIVKTIDNLYRVQFFEGLQIEDCKVTEHSPMKSCHANDCMHTWLL